MNVSLIDAWKLPGCGINCVPRRHSPQQHEAYGFHLALLAQRTEPARVVETGPLVVDLEAARVTVDGRAAYPTATELRLLLALARRPGRLVPYDEILTAAWGPEWVGAGHLLRVNISRLRRRLGHAAGLLVTVGTLGYRLEMLAPGATPEPTARRGAYLPKLPPGRWAWRWERCTCCGRTDRPHEGHGRCSSCRLRTDRGRQHPSPCAGPPADAGVTP